MPPSVPMKLEHIGIAVDQIDVALQTFEQLIGHAAYKSEHVEGEKVDTHFFSVAGVKLELLSATDEQSVIKRFIEKRREGIHHLAFSVSDLHGAASRLRAAGFEIIGEDEKEGADGKSIFFLHPRMTHGVLIEFCANARSGLTPVTTVSKHGLHCDAYGSASNPHLLLLSASSPLVEPVIRRLEPDFRIHHAHGTSDSTLDFSSFVTQHIEIDPSHPIQIISFDDDTGTIPGTMLNRANASRSAWIHIMPPDSQIIPTRASGTRSLLVSSREPGNETEWPFALLPAFAINPSDTTSDVLTPLIRSFLSHQERPHKENH